MTPTSRCWDVMVVGAGPGGLMAAIRSASLGRQVLVVEKNQKPGRKLLATGGGQCNITHQMPLKSFLNHYHEKAAYAGKCIRQFPPEDLMRWFSQRGVQLEVLESGKVFPVSRKATEVLQVLLDALQQSGGELMCGRSVKKLEVTASGFEVTCDDQVFRGKSVILATGGFTYPSLGTVGDGYQLASALGHRVVTPRPALTGLSIKNWKLGSLAGISLQAVQLSHWREGRKTGAYTGDLLFTHQGISGPVVLNYSRHFQPGDILTLNLMTPEKEGDFSDRLLREMQTGGKRKVKTLLYQETVPRRVLEGVMEMAGVPVDQPCASVTKEQRKRLVKWLTGMPVEVSDWGDLEAAMVTTGGVATDEIRSSTMESLKVPGLFFAGEIQDVDGMTGGFNLQFAFSSGYVAGGAAAGQKKGKAL